jgi:glutaredoxin
LVLYTKAGCCLCDEMKAALEQCRASRPWRLEVVDIERDPELFERFKHSIPVLEIGGRVAFKGRLTAREFERKFARLAAEWEARTEPPAEAGKEA